MSRIFLAFLFLMMHSCIPAYGGLYSPPPVKVQPKISTNTMLGKADNESTLYIVAIGINNFVDPEGKPLVQKFAHRDAEEFSRILSERAAGLFNQIDRSVLLDVSAPDMETAINRVVSVANPQDTFVLFYAGPGIDVQLKDKEVKIGYFGHPEPADIASLDTILPSSQISNFFDKQNVLTNSVTGAQLAALCSRVMANQQLIVLDSCYSGASIPKIKELLLTKPEIDGCGRKLAVLALQAASYESENKEFFDQHGAFTKAVIDGLSDETDSNGDGQISVGELYETLQPKLDWLHTKPSNCTGQDHFHPKVSEKFLSGGDFVIAETPKAVQHEVGVRTVGALPAVGKSSMLPVASKGHALLFATDVYCEDASLSPLKNPIYDANEIAKVLQEKYGWKVDVRPNPTVVEIRETLKKYSEMKIDPDSELLIFFAGHGIYDEQKKTGYIAATNSKTSDLKNTWFSHAELARYVTGTLNVWPHTVLIMDACFAGEVEHAFKHEVIVKDFRRTEKTQYLPVPSGAALYSDLDAYGYYNSVLVPRKTQWFIVSGMGPVSDGKQHSPFAKKLIDVLTRSAEPAGKGFLTRRDIEAQLELLRSGPISADVPGVGGGGPFVFVPAQSPSSIETKKTISPGTKR